MNKIKQNIIRYSRFIYRITNTIYTRIFWNIFNSSKFLKSKHLDWLIKTNKNKSEKYVSISDSNINKEIVDKNPKIISFYLPQYHENEVNNKYFGKGFMEWYKATKAIPQFTGHYQPHLPIDVGFYDLTHDDIMYRQIELAKKYGIYGFCFYYYWFSGDTLLEKPLLNFLNNNELDFPFCLMWTNETWTNVWGNGNHRDIIKKQELLDDDYDKFVNDILKYITDKRYIKIDGKPLIIIYQSKFFEKDKFDKFVNNLKTKVKNITGLDLYLSTTNSGINTNDTIDLDAVVEFSHQSLPISKYNASIKNVFINPYFKGKIVDIKRALNENLHLLNNKHNTFKCLYPGWDNTPRKAYSLNGCYVFDMGPKEYKKWLSDIIKWTKKNHSKEEQIVFINAWNEWAEGAHLEPDQHYGYAYLQATKEALEEDSGL